MTTALNIDYHHTEPSPRPLIAQLEDDEPEEVYLVVVGVDAFCGKHEHLKKFKTYSTEEGDYKTTYFQTFGGGGEGGYFLRTFYGANGFDPINEVYIVGRNWGLPFTAEKIEGVLDYNERGDGTAGTIRFISK